MKPYLVICLTLLFAVPAHAGGWSRFVDPEGRYRIDLPTTSFQMEPYDRPGHRTLSELDGSAVIDTYSGRNLKRLGPSEFIAQLSAAPRIRDITYIAKGRSWFAISGHYVREGSEVAGLIYYAKFVFSRDLTRFAAFELSYPVSEKRRMDPVVVRLEESMRLSQ